VELLTINGFVFNPEGSGFVPGLTLGATQLAECVKDVPRLLLSKVFPDIYPSLGSPNITYNGQCIVHAESLMMIYLLKEDDINSYPNLILEEIFIQRINHFKEWFREEWGLNIRPNPMRARDDELKKSTSESSDILFVFLTFTILVIYSVAFNFNIDMFKAKVYTAIAGVGAAILGMISGVGFVCYFNVAMVPTTLVVPFLSMGIGVDDMFVIINSYSLSYPIKDPKERIKQTMRESGLSITITTLTNMIAFSIGSFSPYLSIKNFCLFSAGALGFGYLFALTITVAILALESMREIELASCCCFPVDALKNYEVTELKTTTTPNFGPSDTPSNVVKRRVHKAFAEDPYWRKRTLKAGVILRSEPSMSPTFSPSTMRTPMSHTGMFNSIRPAERLALILENASDGNPSDHQTIQNHNNNNNNTSSSSSSSQSLLHHTITDQQQCDVFNITDGGPLTEIVDDLGDTGRLNDTMNMKFNERDTLLNDLVSESEDRHNYSLNDTKYFADDIEHGAEPPVSNPATPSMQNGGDMSRFMTGFPPSNLTMYSPQSRTQPLSGRNTALSVSTEFNPGEWHRIKHTVLREPKGNVGRNFREFLLRKYSLILLRPQMKVIVILIFTAFACLSTNGLLKVEQGLDLQDLSPDTSYLKEFDDETKKNFSQYDVPTSLFFKKYIPWHEKEVQDSLAELMSRMEAMKSIVLVIDPLSRILNDKDYFGMSNRYDETYFNSAIKQAIEGVYSQFFADFIFEGDKIVSWKATIFPAAMHSSKQRAAFMISIRKLLDGWNIAPELTTLGCGEDGDDICGVSESKLFLSPIEDNNFSMVPTSIEPLKAYAWNYMMIFYESDLEITSAVAVSMTVAVVAMLFVTLLLLTEITMGLTVVLMLFLIDLNLFGFMYYWDVKLNMISMINLVISVGFAVDYAAHMCHSYTHCKSKTPDMKATEMLVLMGGAVFNGASSTLIGILMLGFSTSYIFRVFFKLFLLVVVFGVSHGMILLPVVLTLVDQIKNWEYHKQLAASVTTVVNNDGVMVPVLKKKDQTE